MTQRQYPYRVMQCLYRLVVISARTYKTENKPIRDNAQISAGPDVSSAECFRAKTGEACVERAKRDIDG